MADLSAADAKKVAEIETVWVDQIQNTQCRVDVGHRFSFITDEPVEIGGGGTAVNPFAMLMAALGTCSIGTLTGYARTHGIPLDGVSIKLERKLNMVDSSGPGDDRELDMRIVRIRREIELCGPETEEQLEELRHAVSRCPVANSIGGSIDIRDEVKLVPSAGVTAGVHA
jgi:uncharacterized OsmC-like protein